MATRRNPSELDVIARLAEQGGPQCESTLVLGKGRRRSVCFCLKRQEHAGDHRGYRAQWNAKGERVEITER